MMNELGFKVYVARQKKIGARHRLAILSLFVLL
jgi:hypothetical protein